MFRFLVSWAFEKGQMPDKVLEEYKRNPKNFQLLMAYSKFEHDRHEKEQREQEQNSGKKKGSVTIMGNRPG